MVFELLRTGAENAVTLQTLVAVTGLDSRTLRRRIAAERKAGRLIVSDNEHGYFRPSGIDDLRRFSRSMHHRAKEILAVALIVDEAIADAVGQEIIGGW